MTENESRFRVVSEMDVRGAVLSTAPFCANLGFDQTASRMIATAVSELARNIVKYTHGGEIRMRRFNDGAHVGVEVEAVDQGPGIGDPELALRDHYSSSGTLGLGLPGVRRLMDEFELHSEPGKGTRVWARKWL